MNILLDTHVLLWALFKSDRLRRQTRALLEDPANELTFSLASLWEASIKYALDREDFPFDPRKVRSAALTTGCKELAITSEHVFQTTLLPPIHKDPFDRLLMAQAAVENLTFLTSDKKLFRYPGAIRRA